MSAAITRQQMVGLMESEFSTSIGESYCHDWRRLNTAVGYQADAKGSGILDFHLIEVTLSGRVRAEFDADVENQRQNRAVLVSGALQYTPPGSEITFETEGASQLHQLYIDDSVFREVAEALAPGDPDNMKPVGFQGVFSTEVSSLAAQLLDEARRSTGGGDLYADLLAQRLAELILKRQNDVATRSQRLRTLSLGELTRVADHIEAHMADTGGLETLAALIDMDVFSFTRAFKATTGQAPHQYLINRRMTKIKELLLHSDEPLVAIAYDTGFSSQSHMTGAFSRATGVSPGRWRREARA